MIRLFFFEKIQSVGFENKFSFFDQVRDFKLDKHIHQ